MLFRYFYLKKYEYLIYGTFLFQRFLLRVFQPAVGYLLQEYKEKQLNKITRLPHHQIHIQSMKFILLELYVDNTRPELYELYKNQIDAHNASLDNNPYPNAGFDLFIPDNVVFDTPFQTKMVDLGVKAQMWEFLPTSKDYTKPAILINDDSKNTITEGEVEGSETTTNEVDVKSDGGVVFSKEGLESFQDYMATGYHLFPRSSIAKTQLIMSNHVGVIDSG